MMDFETYNILICGCLDDIPDDEPCEPIEWFDSFTAQEIEEILAEDKADEQRLQKFIEEEGL